MLVNVDRKAPLVVSRINECSMGYNGRYRKTQINDLRVRLHSCISSAAGKCKAISKMTFALQLTELLLSPELSGSRDIRYLITCNFSAVLFAKCIHRMPKIFKKNQKQDSIKWNHSEGSVSQKMIEGTRTSTKVIKPFLLSVWTYPTFVRRKTTILMTIFGILILLYSLRLRFVCFERTCLLFERAS